jgi:hypothetical protein
MDRTIYTVGIGLRGAACELFGSPEARAAFEEAEGRSGFLRAHWSRPIAIPKEARTFWLIIPRSGIVSSNLPSATIQ